MPPSARWALKQAFNAAEALVSSTSAEDSDLGCLVVLYLPSLLLFPIGRGGAAGWRKWNARFRRFWAGEWESLLREAATYGGPRGRDVFAPQDRGDVSATSEPTPEEIKQRAAARLVGQGELSRAAKRLTADKVATPSAETLEALRRLHPAAEVPQKPVVDPFSTAELTVSLEFLIAAIRTSPRGAAAGVDGWRYEHLRTFLGEARTASEAVPLPSFVSRMLRGRLPADCQAILRAARLFALEKPQGGVRPIAIGSALRRWVTRALCMQNKVAFQEDFAPLQFAVGTEAGGEKVFAAAKTFLETEGGPFQQRTLVSLDAKNAFNCVDRQAMLDALAEKYPSMVNFFWQFYGEPGELWYQMDDGRVETILSRQGTQQGDAAGPFLFCLAFHPALEQLQREFPRAFIGGFMDDVTVGIDSSDTAACVAAAERIFGAYGLELRREKSFAWSPAWETAQDIPASAAAALRCSCWGVKVVGAPLGTAPFVSEFLTNVVRDHDTLLDAIVRFSVSHVQAASLLLRYCAAPRFTYWCRLLPPAVVGDAAGAHDAAIVTTAERIFSSGQLPPNVARQMHLPIRLGGFGLTSCVLVSPAAFLGSAAITAGAVWERFSGRDWMPTGGVASFLSLPWLSAADAVRSSLLPLFTTPQSLPSLEALVERPQSGLQKRLGDAIHDAEFTAFYASLPDGGRARARLLSGVGHGASGFLSAVPVCPRKTLNDFEYRLNVHLRLGLALPHARLARRCLCGDDVDEYGDHFFLCHRGPQRNIRHDAMRDLFRKLLAEVYVRADTEAPLASLGVTPPDQDPNHQRMDLFFVVDGTGYLADVTVTHPCRPDASRPNWRRVNQRCSQRPGGVAARDSERLKRTKYGGSCQQAGVRFVPLAAETFGRWGDETLGLLRELAKRRRVPVGAEQEAAFRESLVTHWTQCLSVGLAKYNAYQVSSRAHRSADASGPTFASEFAEDLICRGPYRPHCAAL